VVNGHPAALDVETPRRHLFRRRRSNRRAAVQRKSLLAALADGGAKIGRTVARASRLAGKVILILGIATGCVWGGRWAIIHVVNSPQFQISSIRFFRHASPGTGRAGAPCWRQDRRQAAWHRYRSSRCSHRHASLGRQRAHQPPAAVVAGHRRHGETRGRGGGALRALPRRRPRSSVQACDHGRGRWLACPHRHRTTTLCGDAGHQRGCVSRGHGGAGRVPQQGRPARGGRGQHRPWLRFFALPSRGWRRDSARSRKIWAKNWRNSIRSSMLSKPMRAGLRLFESYISIFPRAVAFPCFSVMVTRRLWIPRNQLPPS